MFFNGSDQPIWPLKNFQIADFCNKLPDFYVAIIIVSASGDNCIFVIFNSRSL